MQLLSCIRQLRIVKPRDDDRNSVVRVEVENPNANKRYLWGLIRIHRDQRLSESLNAGECVTVGMILLAQGTTNQEPGTMAHSYALSALNNLRDELEQQVIMAKAIAEFTKAQTP